MGLYADTASLTDGWTDADDLPAQPERAEVRRRSSTNKIDFFSGQTANKDVYVPAENAYKGVIYSPFTVYYYAQLQAQIDEDQRGQDRRATRRRPTCRRSMVKYAKSQGFTVQVAGAWADGDGSGASDPGMPARPRAPRIQRKGARMATQTPRSARIAGRAIGPRDADRAEPLAGGEPRAGGTGRAGCSSLPFAIVFVVFLVAPLAYAFYLSLYTKGLATGHAVRGLRQLHPGVHRPVVPQGRLVRACASSLVLIPVQMVVSLAAALVLDAITTRFARFARLMIFLPYAVPAVIGALMWGFLYSPSFGPLEQIFGSFGANAPFLLEPGQHLLRPRQRGDLAVGRLLHDHHLRGSAGHRPHALRGGADRRRQRLAGRVPHQGADGRARRSCSSSSSPSSARCSSSPSRRSSRPIANGSITPDFTPNIYAFNLAFQYAQFNYASAISFALGIVVFIARVHLPIRHPQARECLRMTARLHLARRHAADAAGPRARSRGTMRRPSLPRRPDRLLPDPALVAVRREHQGRDRRCSADVRRAVVRQELQPRGRTCRTCSPTTAASTCAGSATPCSTPSSGGIGATVIAVLAGLRVREVPVPRPQLHVRAAARLGDGAAHRAGDPDLHPVVRTST